MMDGLPWAASLRRGCLLPDSLRRGNQEDILHNRPHSLPTAKPAPMVTTRAHRGHPPTVALKFAISSYLRLLLG